ncbi:MAG: HD domain-containing protein [Patescibacteria group bacterium]
MSNKALEKIKIKAKKFFLNARGSHGWDHIERVYNIALHIGRKEKADLEILKLAALLHDISREYADKQNGNVCHAEHGAEKAKSILKKFNFPAEKIEKITHCIKCHRFRGKNIPKSKEAKILFDADKLDAVGAVGIGRAFLFAGEIGARLHNSEIDIEKTKAYSKEDTAYREFALKLSKIKDRMLTREGKNLAQERHKFMVEFFKKLDKEIAGKE